MTQRALFAETWPLESIVREVERWTDDRRYRFWERVGIVSDGRFDEDSVVRVWCSHIEGGG